MDYGYVNARVKGMYSQLMDRRAFEALMFKPDLADIISELGNSPYRDEMEEASVLYPGILGIEYAMRMNLIRTFRTILQLVKGETAERYITIFLNKWDVQNIKTILRGKKIHATLDEIRGCMVPAGELDEATLHELLKQPDIKAVVDLLATWQIDYAGPLTAHFDAYAKNGDLVILEYALDRFYYEHALDLVKGRSFDEQIVRDLLRTEIDVTNIKTIVKTVRERIDPEEAGELFLLQGKYLDRIHLLKIAHATSIEQVVRSLDATPYRFLADLPEQAFRAETISVFEKALDRYLTRKAMRLYRGNPLSITIVIGYLWAKYNEIINIRIISRCKNARVSDEDLEGELIYV